jgi:TonB-linked SusC/RagA family outer membrane protein
MGRYLLFGACSLHLLCTVTLAQERTVTGTVNSLLDGSPLPGVQVVVRGTAIGTVCDPEGNYSLDIPAGDVSLQFSFSGYTTRIMKVGRSAVIDVSLSPEFSALEEELVTSLGIERKKKEIPYAAQNVSTEALSRARELNVVNSLQGKAAGLDIIKSSSGLGSASRVIIRGNQSIAGNNQPLFIVDGVPIQNFAWSTPDSENGGLQGEDGIGNINPEDIASITVLKGPNAAALYGSRAANGAIVLATRKGTARKGIGVEFNTNLSADKALTLTRFQYVYGQGSGGDYRKNSEEAWGPKMEGQLVDHWSPDPNFAGPEQYPFNPHHNFEDFFNTGYNLANTLTLTAGNDKARSLFSYTSTLSQGIVEHNKLRRNNFNLRIDGNLRDRFSYDFKVTYFNQRVDNRLATGDDFNNPLRAIYRQPSNISLEQAKDFEYFDEAGILLQHYWNPNTNGGQNVYWMLNRTIREEKRDRIIAMGSLRYMFTENLSLLVRSSIDQIIDHASYRQYHDTHTIADYGNLSLDNRNALEWNSDFLVNYHNTWKEGTFSLDASFGVNIMIQNRAALNTRTNRLLKPNLFVITNTDQIRATQDGLEKQVNSLYGFLTLGYKDFLFLHVTGRNDWSSTLPKNRWSYFYPSAGLSWIITEMLDTRSGILTFAKVRASYARVGNETDPYRIDQTYDYSTGGIFGYAWRDETSSIADLKPEKTKSIELGFDVRFLNNRLGMDFTWYKSNTFNQLLTVQLPRASGYTGKFINAGNVRNKGIELTLNATPVQVGDFRWDIAVNYARNENLVVELSDELREYTVRGRSWISTIKAVEGQPYGQIYANYGIERNSEGRMLINSLGLPLLKYGPLPMGNASPDWIGGLASEFNFKGISLSILMDTRMGGNIFSWTEMNLLFEGFSEATLAGRDGFVADGLRVISDGHGNIVGYEENTIETNAEWYWHSLGGRSTAVGEICRHDASYVRIREVLLGYTFPVKSNAIQSIGLSLYGRNLGFLYNAAEILDPNMSVGTGNIQGLEGFSVPTARTYGLNARFRF